MLKHGNCAALFAALTLSVSMAAEAQILINHAKAVAGNVTAGDAPGYPVTLSRSGAYILGGNLNPPASKVGIEITATNVDLDMNGYRLFGAGLANAGIQAIAGHGRIHDGFIVDFFTTGIRLIGPCHGWVIENMQITNNGSRGISSANCDHMRYLKNSVLENGSDGLACGRYCHVEGNIASDNGGVGILIKSGTVLGNSIFANVSYGLSSGAGTGFGNNTLMGNGSITFQQTNGVPEPMQPNHCAPANTC